MSDGSLHQGCTYVITGASRGIGRALAEELIDRGASVVSVDVAHPNTEVPGLDSFIADVSDVEQMAAIADQVIERHGRVHGVVCNAAIYAGLSLKPFDEIDVAEWDRVMAVNVRGVWASCRAFAPALRATAAQGDDAAILNVSSAAALAGETGVLHYVASKGAVLALTRALARELGPSGVRVNAVAPGFTMSEGSTELAGDRIDRLAERVRNQRALRRDLDPPDLVAAMAMLLSSDARLVTGQCLVVDGGAVMT